MGYVLSQKSLDRLKGVHPDLVKVVKRAIELTKVDFVVGEGLRSKERQAELVAAGDSWTMDSRHLTGHAVDLWAYVGGKVSWNWEHYYTIGAAMRQAASELGVDIRWGGLWDAHLTAQTYTPLKQLQEAYVTEYKRRKGKSPNLDGPHFELHRDSYPA